MIRLSGVEVRVPNPAGPGGKVLLEGIDLEFSERRVALVGANGSGKSTLLRLLNGLILPSSGRVEVDGHDTRTDAAAVRRLVGFTFSDALSQLVLPTALDDVELSLRARVRDRADRRAVALDWLDRYGLGEVAERSIYDLSGGERQLAALVSVLAVEPSILVCDEPTTLLDLRNRNVVTELLAGVPQRVILSTHDLDLAGRCDRVLLIDSGRVLTDGPPQAVLPLYRELMA